MKTPIHLWIVGVLSLLWNAGGAFDYVMTRSGSAEYLAQMPDERLAMLQNAPLWFDVSWPVGVWFSVIGSLLLLLRSRFAVAAFRLSLIGLAASMVYTYGIADPSALTMGGPFEATFTAAIIGVLLLLIVYARVMRNRGVLR
ncbi:hypothetical protein [Yoonia sp. 208BN28-4]|uniref:hypothetical protein n=1 Tax=Yoonia sp. 208BN28-4 TaxID=3126505 RepID=UPI003099F3F5